MVTTRILIGGDIPVDSMGRIAELAVEAGYVLDLDGRDVSGDLDGYCSACADAGKPVGLLREGAAVLMVDFPEIGHLHEFLGFESIPFQVFHPPYDGMDGEIAVWAEGFGFEAYPATAAGEPLITAAEVEYQRGTGIYADHDSTLADGEILDTLMARVAIMREGPPPAAFAVPSPAP